MSLIKYTGIIEFDPHHLTKKHEDQGRWKRMAIIYMPGDIAAYYSWYVLKRFDLKILKPARGPHISFISDRFMDIDAKGGHAKQALWNKVKNKYQGKKIDMVLDTDVRTNGDHWWLNVETSSRQKIQSIRDQLGFDKPYFGLHMSLGYAANVNLSHQIHGYIKNGVSW